jgi:hypothetical protein
MNKVEREKLAQIRDDLKAAKQNLPLRAEYVKGAANHGAGGAMVKAIVELDRLIGNEDGDDAGD